jgi:hypothetical protein
MRQLVRVVCLVDCRRAIQASWQSTNTCQLLHIYIVTSWWWATSKQLTSPGRGWGYRSHFLHSFLPVTNIDFNRRHSSVIFVSRWSGGVQCPECYCIAMNSKYWEQLAGTTKVLSAIWLRIQVALSLGEWFWPSEGPWCVQCLALKIFRNVENQMARRHVPEDLNFPAQSRKANGAGHFQLT